MNPRRSSIDVAAVPRSEQVRFALMLQDWCDLTFVHWPYPVKVVRRLVPLPLEIDKFDGSAWVGITPFVLSGLRPALLPSLPWISRFPETNCRTYVKGPDGHAGVWFFSLDAARAPAVAAARLGFGLPYAWSRMRVEKTRREVRYESARRWPDAARTNIIVEPGDPAPPEPLNQFLTARFRLYSFVFGRLTYTRVEHAPWPLRSARAVRIEQTLTAAAGLPDAQEPPAVHFSPGVHVRIAAPHRVA